MVRATFIPVVLVLICCRCALASTAGLADYARGLQQITAGQYADAVESIEKSIDAFDEDANRHLACAIALMMDKRGDEAAAYLQRAGKLEPRHQGVPVWNYFYLWAFAPRQRSIPETPHWSKEPYTNALLNATTEYWGARERNLDADMQAAWNKVEQIAHQWAWRELARPEMLSAQASSLDALYADKQYEQCLSIVGRLLESNPTDVRLLGISGGSKLALKDYQGARNDYTLAMTFAPTSAPLILGRSLAAARMGALRTAEADREIAPVLDAKMYEQFKAELDTAIAKSRERVPTESPAQLLPALRSAAEADDAGKLAEAADRLIRADVAVRMNSDEAYTQELARLQAAFDQDKGNVDKAVAVGAFCINPSITIPARLASDGSQTARVRVGKPDLDRARRALDAAGKLNPDHHGALTQHALWMRAKGSKQRMIQVVEKAFEVGALNYDLAKMYLDYYQELAAALEAEAAALRMPTVTYEERADGRWRVEYPPTAAALAKAAQLDAQAKEYRRKSMIPIRQFAEKNSNAPFGKIAYAELHRMVGEYDQAVASAEEALKIDPWHLEAREYLVDLCPKIGMNQKAVAHQDILNNLLEPSARNTLGPVPTLLERTRYSSALERIDAAELKDPASTKAALLRAITLTQAGKKQPAQAAFRVASAMESARLGLQPAEAPVQASNAALALCTHKAAAKLFAQFSSEQSWNQLDAMLKLADRVPKSQWKVSLPETNVPTVFIHNDDKRRTGMYVAEFVVDAQMEGAKLLASMDRLDDAGRLLVKCRQDSEPMGMKPPVDAAAYPIITKMGEKRASKIFPPLMMEGYRVMKKMGRLQNTFEGTETVGVDPKSDRKAWIEARLREIDQELEVLQPSQTLTAMRKREELEDEKQRLKQELSQLQTNPTRRRRGP